jgi:hypothetical protein
MDFRPQGVDVRFAPTKLDDSGVVVFSMLGQGSLQPTDMAVVAGPLLTTEAMIADKPEPKGAGGGGMPGMIQVPDQRLTRPDSPLGGG